MPNAIIIARMTHTIRNMTHSPYDLPTLSGSVVLPAFGEVTAEFDENYLAILGMVDSVRVLPVEGNMWAEEYERLTGKRPDKRWSEARLVSELEKL